MYKYRRMSRLRTNASSDDPDAPSAKNPRPEGPWVHWVAYNIDANAKELKEKIERVGECATRRCASNFD
jgi:phosphatidylethanolamine-binding protein (PEBP) family uncharacterized protein